jgi:hypothetical protein
MKWLNAVMTSSPLLSLNPMHLRLCMLKLYISSLRERESV